MSKKATLAFTTTFTTELIISWGNEDGDTEQVSEIQKDQRQICIFENNIICVYYIILCRIFSCEVYLLLAFLSCRYYIDFFNYLLLFRNEFEPRMSYQILGKVFGGANNNDGKNADSNAFASTVPDIVLNWSKTKTIDLSSLLEDHTKLGADILRDSKHSSNGSGRKIIPSKIDPASARPYKKDVVLATTSKHPPTSSYRAPVAAHHKQHVSQPSTRPSRSALVVVPTNTKSITAHGGSSDEAWQKKHTTTLASVAPPPPPPPLLPSAPHRAHLKLRPATSKLALASAKWLSEENKKVREWLLVACLTLLYFSAAPAIFAILL
jgi:hypothetical protein